MSLINDGTTICVRLAIDPGTEVLFGLFPSRQAERTTSESLELELRDFTDRCIRPNTNVYAESYYTPNDVDFENVICRQAIISLEPDRWWFARAYARQDGDQLLLVHWNGPRSVTSVVTAIFISLVPNFAIE